MPITNAPHLSGCKASLRPITVSDPVIGHSKVLENLQACSLRGKRPSITEFFVRQRVVKAEATLSGM